MPMYLKKKTHNGEYTYMVTGNRYEFYFTQPNTIAKFIVIKDGGKFTLVSGIEGKIVTENADINPIMDKINESPGGLVVFHNMSEGEVPQNKLIPDFVYFFVQSGKFINLDLHNTWSSDAVAGRLSLSQMPTGTSGYVLEAAGVGSDPQYVDPNGRYLPASHSHTRSEITDFWNTPFWDNIPDKPTEFPPTAHTHDWTEVLNKPATYPPDSHTHVRADITDFWSTPFWANIPDKPAAFPPEAHTHVVAEITDWTNLNVLDITDGTALQFELYTGDSLGLVAGSNISLTFDTANKKVTIGVVGGSGSGLDADTLDGYDSSYFAPATHTHTRSQVTDFFSAPFWSAIPDKPFDNFQSIPDSMYPSVDNTYDIGSATMRWKDGYFAGNLTVDGSVYEGGTALSSKYALSDLSNVSDSTILNKLLNVDGSGSGLDADTVDGLQAWQFLRSDTSDTMSGSLTVNGTIYANRVYAGYGGGSVALTINDGYGNANVTFNHAGGVPEQNGNAGRIEVNVDSTSATAYMSFELKTGVTASTATALTQVLLLRETEIVPYKTVRPSATNAIDLGNTTYQWRNGYFAGTVYGNRLNGIWEDPDNDVSIAADSDQWIHVKDKARTTYKGVACGSLFINGAYIDGSTTAVYPRNDATYDLGTSTLQFKDGYFSGLVYSGGKNLIKAGNGTRNIFVTNTTPTAEAVGDIWIQTA